MPLCPDDDHVLDLQAAPAELVVGRLDAQHHARLEHVAARRRDVGKIVAIDADAVAHMAAPIVRDALATHGLDHGFEHVGAAHARTDQLVGAQHAAMQCPVVALRLWRPARRAWRCGRCRRGSAGSGRRRRSGSRRRAARRAADGITFGMALRRPKPMQPSTGKPPSATVCRWKASASSSSVAPTRATASAASIDRSAMFAARVRRWISFGVLTARTWRNS